MGGLVNPTQRFAKGSRAICSALTNYAQFLKADLGTPVVYVMPTPKGRAAKQTRLIRCGNVLVAHQTELNAGFRHVVGL